MCITNTFKLIINQQTYTNVHSSVYTSGVLSNTQSSEHEQQLINILSTNRSFVNCSTMKTTIEPAFTPIAFDEKLFQDVYVNKAATDKAANYYGNFSIAENASDHIELIIKFIQLLDYTTLSADNTSSSITHHCIRAVYPFGELMHQSKIDKLSGNKKQIYTAAVCVYPSHVSTAAKVLQKLDPANHVRIAAVATGFPSGQYPLSTRLDEIRLAIEAGATEIDVVVDRTLVVLNQWQQLYDELVCMRQACGPNVHLKTILAVGECKTYENVYKASMIAMMAGSDFIKTSTGKETVNATLSFGLVMMRAIKSFYELTGRRVGLKPAGGIQTYAVAAQWGALVTHVLGPDWLTPALFRIGASGLLDNLIKALESYS